MNRWPGKTGIAAAILAIAPMLCAQTVHQTFSVSGEGFSGGQQARALQNKIHPGGPPKETTITLTYKIDESGIVSVNAATTSVDPVFIAAVDEWDNPNVGRVMDERLFGKSFRLTGSAEGGRPTLSVKDGGGFGITGINAGRIDRAGEEIFTWKFTSPHQLKLDFNSWTPADLASSGSGLRVSVGPRYEDFGYMDAVAPLPFKNPGIVLEKGESISWTRMQDAEHGSAVAAFSFDIVSTEPEPVGIPEPSALALVVGLLGLAVVILRRRA